MKSYKHYIRYEKENKGTFTIICAVILLCLVVLAILTMCGVIDDITWKPDVVYPMANAKISWLQTYHPGAWAQ